MGTVPMSRLSSAKHYREDFVAFVVGVVQVHGVLAVGAFLESDVHAYSKVYSPGVELTKYFGGVALARPTTGAKLQQHREGTLGHAHLSQQRKSEEKTTLHITAKRTRFFTAPRNVPTPNLKFVKIEGTTRPRTVAKKSMRSTTPPRHSHHYGWTTPSRPVEK